MYILIYIFKNTFLLTSERGREERDRNIMMTKNQGSAVSYMPSIENEAQTLVCALMGNL